MALETNRGPAVAGANPASTGLLVAFADLSVNTADRPERWQRIIAPNTDLAEAARDIWASLPDAWRGMLEAEGETYARLATALARTVASRGITGAHPFVALFVAGWPTGRRPLDAPMCLYEAP